MTGKMNIEALKRANKAIHTRARELKTKDPNLGHRDAIKLASKQLKDENFFKSREDAIKWLEKMKKEDELFADGDTLILSEMFFT